MGVASNGYVEDWYACENEFTRDGRDLGAPAVVVDDLNWANTFVGAYGLGDVQMLRYHGMNNAHAWYVKSSKNFATREDILDETWDTGRQIMSADSFAVFGPLCQPTFQLIDCDLSG